MRTEDIDPKKIEWRSDTTFLQTAGEALEELTASKQQHLRTTRAITKNDRDLAAQDAYHERATNPKPARHPRPMRTANARGEYFNKVEPNQGEYMAGWRRDALTVPDRSIPALRHPKWLAGRGVCELFPEPSLELMGPHHPVKEQIKKSVAHMRHEVLKKGPILGPKNAKERLEEKAVDVKKHGRGQGVWVPPAAQSRVFNTMVFNKEKYLTEREKDLAQRPARCNPKLPQIYTNPGSLLDHDLKLLGQ